MAPRTPPHGTRRADRRGVISRALALLLVLAGGLPAAPLSAQSPVPARPPQRSADPLLWPEPQRAFFQDGPGLLLSDAERAELAALDEAGRDRFIRELLDRDPVPETKENELREGIARRRTLADSEYLSPLDVRAQLLFLHGKPSEKVAIDCGTAFKPLEIWAYRGSEGGAASTANAASESAGAAAAPLPRAVIYRPGADQPFQLWQPGEGKRVLYTSEMEYWLEQWEELGGVRAARRFDLQICKQANLVDQATGIQGLTGGGRRRAREQDADDAARRASFTWPGSVPGGGALAPPADLGRWARQAAATQVPAAPAPLEASAGEVQFPERAGQRMLARLFVRVTGAQPTTVTAEEEGKPELRLTVDGVVELEGRAFEEFRLRVRTPPQDGPLDLAVDRPLRPQRRFLVRLRIRDEVSGAEARVARGFEVPIEPVVPAGARAIAAVTPEDARGGLASGPDTLTMLPPSGEVQLGLWRAEALATGKRIVKVVFSVDGQNQLVRTRPPFTAELRLSKFPTEQVVKVEGFDEAGKLVASDQLVLNQARGAFRVSIIDPPRGARPTGKTTARAEVSVPEEKRLAKVEFKVNDAIVAALTSPPWQAEIQVPTGEEVVYLAVSAELEDGARAEDVRFLRAPEYLEEVEVDLVELYATVTERSGELVRGLKQEDFEVLEAGEKQEIAKFELVENLPLTIGVVLDTSGSMTESLAEAQHAAVEFLRKVVTGPKDRCFTMSFSGRPVLRMPMSDDVEAAARSLDGLLAVGPTSLHDAIVHSLYYFRGIFGQKALVLLSDGDDTSSDLPFNDALEYAKRSGVAVYTVGLRVPITGFGVRTKLTNLAEETGGQVYFIGRAEELASVYSKIEQELRSRYLLAFNSKRAAEEQGYRQVEVRVLKRGLKARTARGYYP